MKNPSLKKNFLWAFVGNVFYALCGYLLLCILTKTSSVEMVGLWGVAQAVALPVATFFSLRISTVNITDIGNEYQTGHYIAVRLTASLMSMLVTATIGFIFYPVDVAVIIALMGVSQSVAEVRSYFMSNMQKYERLNLATRSQIAEGSLTLLFFGTVFWFTQNLLLAITGTIISRLSILLLHDMPVSARVLSAHVKETFKGYFPLWQWSRLWTLLRQTAPLAVVAGMANLFRNIPRLVMDQTLGREAVGYFTALSMFLVTYMMINVALGNAALPRLSKYYSENIKAFVWLFVRLIVTNLCLGIGFVVVVFFFGRPLLTLLFTADYTRHKDVLVMLAVSSCLFSIFSVANWGLNATRQFIVQVPIYAGTAVVSWVSSMFLIEKYGLMGGAYVLIISYFFGASACLAFVVKGIKKSVN